jgi:hypothetical protein
MKTLLQMEMYYVIEYTPTCRFKKIINSTLTDCKGLVDYFLNFSNNSNTQTYLIIMDFAKVFDKVPHPQEQKDKL